MDKFAIIETGGKQYKVAPGQKLKIEKLNNASQNNDVVFNNVLLTASHGVTVIGAPYINGASVHAKKLNDGRDKKKIIFRYHSKTRYRKKKGHRQPFTEVEIVSIS